MKINHPNREKARNLLNEYHQLQLVEQHLERCTLKISVTFSSQILSGAVQAPSTTIPLADSEYKYMREYIKRRKIEIDKELEKL